MSYFNFKLFNRPVKNVNTDLEYKKPNKIEKVTASTTVSFSDITDVGFTGVADYKARVNTIAPASFHDFTTWYGPVTEFGTTYQGVYGNSAPPSGNANFSLPLPTLYNHISITYNNPHPGGSSDAVYIFIGGVGSGALPTELYPPPGQAVDKITNGTTGASKTYSQRYQAGDYLKIQEKGSVITTALVIKLSLIEPVEAPGWAPGYPIKGGRAPILGYRKSVDCSNNCQNEKIYKDNWAKSCARNGEVCYNPVIKRIQNKNGKIDTNYNYNTRNLLRSRFSTYEQNAYNFDLSGNLTAWTGGADPANNSYLIHDCSCNAPFTSNNPCIATYKPLNRQFAVNTAVSGRSRIARLKYNAKKRVAATKTIPFGLLGYPKNSCEFCKRDFKPSKGRKGGDNKSRINSRLGPIVAPPLPPCCGEALPAGVIKICTGFNSGSNCVSATYTSSTYDTVGYLKDAQPNWTNGSGCNGWDPLSPTPPTTGRLGNYTTAGYPDIGTMCSPDATYRGHTIGGFAWNPVDEHLWFFLKDANMFAGGATPSGFQFTSIEFSNSSSFPVGNTAILYAVADGTDYDSGSTYEIHWSNGLTGWTTALPKLKNIFGDGSVTKNVYIKFDLKLFTFTKSIKSWNPLFGAVDQQAWLPSAIFTAVGSSPWTGAGEHPAFPSSAQGDLQSYETSTPNSNISDTNWYDNAGGDNANIQNTANAGGSSIFPNWPDWELEIVSVGSYSTDCSAPPSGSYTKNNSQYKSNFIGRYTIGSYEPGYLYTMGFTGKMDSSGNNNNWWKIYYGGAAGITPSTANSTNFSSLGLQYPQQMFTANCEILSNVVMRILWKGNPVQLN